MNWDTANWWKCDDKLSDNELLQLLTADDELLMKNRHITVVLLGWNLHKICRTSKMYDHDLCHLWSCYPSICRKEGITDHCFLHSHNLLRQALTKNCHTRTCPSVAYKQILPEFMTCNADKKIVVWKEKWHQTQSHRYSKHQHLVSKRKKPSSDLLYTTTTPPNIFKKLPIPPACVLLSSWQRYG